MLPEVTPKYIEVVHAFFIKEGRMTVEQAKAEVGTFGPITQQVYRDVCMSNPNGLADYDIQPSSFGPTWFNDLLLKNVSVPKGGKSKPVPKGPIVNQERAKQALLLHRRELAKRVAEKDKSKK